MHARSWQVSLGAAQAARRSWSSSAGAEGLEWRLRRGRAARRAAAAASSVCLIVFRVRSAQIGKQPAQTIRNRLLVAMVASPPEQRPINTAAASNGHGANVAAPTSATSSKSRSATASTTATIVTERSDAPGQAHGSRSPCA